MRQALKVAVESTIVATGLARLARARRVDDTLVLAYHNIVPHGESPVGDRSLHLPCARFVEQLDALAETHDVVALDTLTRDRTAERRRPRAVITFDDAYCGAVSAGVDELVRREMPATIFVPPAFLGGHSFWWDALTPPTESAVSAAIRAHALDTLRGEDAAVRRWAIEEGLAEWPVPEHARCASFLSLTAALSRPGMSVGSHSWSHANLARLSASELAHEIGSPLTWLRARFTAVSSYLSYPYGATSETVRAVASDAGYLGGLLISGGWIGTQLSSTFATPRLDVAAGLTENGFRLRISGLFCQ